MGLRPCGLQVVVFSWSPQLLDLFTWSGSWTFRPWLQQTFPTEPVTSEAHPYPHRCGAGDANLMNLTAGFVDVYSDGSLNGIRVDANLCDLQNIVTSEALPYPHRLRPVRGRRTRIKYVIGLTGLVEEFRHSGTQAEQAKGCSESSLGILKVFRRGDRARELQKRGEGGRPRLQHSKACLPTKPSSSSSSSQSLAIFLHSPLLLPPVMTHKGKAATVTEMSGMAPTGARGPKYWHNEGLHERFWISDDYNIVLAKEEESTW
ncbi:hypothetical protein Taro_004990 [Colocasia esculenta]|uniref:Uncharacterized protein n=1 Tax=Colocasia esculenta TaxID=4460 RepID=A0A843TNU2_COLES|nr:hypothetical protein [Colocasia esculenta]